jgi:hypothetical protein
MLYVSANETAVSLNLHRYANGGLCMHPDARLLLGKMRRRMTGAAGTTGEGTQWWAFCDDGGRGGSGDGGGTVPRSPEAAEVIEAEYNATTRALAKVQTLIDQKSCSPLRLRSLRHGDAPSEAMMRAQLAAMDEDWVGSSTHLPPRPVNASAFNPW